MNFTGNEVHFQRDELIVSKTDVQGRLTYTNHTFLDRAALEYYSERQRDICLCGERNQVG